jgi:hypothetical protein
MMQHRIKPHRITAMRCGLMQSNPTASPHLASNPHRI